MLGSRKAHSLQSLMYEGGMKTYQVSQLEGWHAWAIQLLEQLIEG